VGFGRRLGLRQLRLGLLHLGRKIVVAQPGQYGPFRHTVAVLHGACFLIRDVDLMYLAEVAAIFERQFVLRRWQDAGRISLAVPGAATWKVVRRFLGLYRLNGLWMAFPPPAARREGRAQ